MPRSQVSPAVKVLEFFSTAPLPEAVLVLSLCAAEILRRKRQRVEPGAQDPVAPRQARRKTPAVPGTSVLP